MGYLKIYRDSYTDCTIISNRFIDKYMADANDAQLKIYLYLLRMMRAGEAFDISGIADAFNHTEKDVMRALRYWEKHGVLMLEYDGDRNLAGIRLLDLDDPAARSASGGEPSRSCQPAQKDASGRSCTDGAQASPGSAARMPSAGPGETGSGDMAAPLRVELDERPRTGGMLQQFPESTAAPAGKGNASFTRPSYTLDQLKAFQEKDSTAQLLFIAEQYLGRPLSSSDMKSILFFSDGLRFSDDLIDYLLQYCIERGKKDFRYIEKVAISWAEAHVTTPAEAENHASKYDRTVYTIMNALGKTNAPTRREAEFIRRWREDYGFEPAVIMIACDRTVLATDRHRFEYADKILAAWKGAGVRHEADIARLDKGFQKENPGKAVPLRPADKYNRFMQNSYDYDALERELLHN